MPEKPSLIKIQELAGAATDVEDRFLWTQGAQRKWVTGAGKGFDG